jgi:hypothetical protein
MGLEILKETSILWVILKVVFRCNQILLFRKELHHVVCTQRKRPRSRGICDHSRSHRHRRDRSNGHPGQEGQQHLQQHPELPAFIIGRESPNEKSLVARRGFFIFNWPVIRYITLPDWITPLVMHGHIRESHRNRHHSRATTLRYCRQF